MTALVMDSYICLSYNIAFTLVAGVCNASTAAASSTLHLSANPQVVSAGVGLGAAEAAGALHEGAGAPARHL